ncbi:hypothetical protein KKA03_02740 [archaeon]|nr:hypothetical protein [archaeon]
MEGEPFKLLIIVLLFAFTIGIGFTALDNARETSEKASCYKSVNSFLIKTQIVLSGAPGSRETVDFILDGDANLVLYNDNINGTLYGVVKASLGDGTHYLQVLPSPVGENGISQEYNRTFIAGEHSVRLTHKLDTSGADYLGVG